MNRHMKLDTIGHISRKACLSSVWSHGNAIIQKQNTFHNIHIWIIKVLYECNENIWGVGGEVVEWT